MKQRSKTLLLLLALLPAALCAQEHTPGGSYNELPDPQQPVASQWAKVKTPTAAWGSTNIRYAKNSPLTAGAQSLRITGWKGEKVNAQAVISANTAIGQLSYSLSAFKNSKGELLPADAFAAGFVRYVMTDELNKDGKGGCGYRPDHTVYDSTLVADPIDHLTKVLPVKAMNAQPIWISCSIPQQAAAGIYKGVLTVKQGEQILRALPLEIQVTNRTLPAPKEWSYHLDLWQNPFAVARYNKVKLWSQEHFDAMRPTMKLLAEGGQKIATASIMHKPWGGQTYDYFESMVTWTKKVDGTWAFDYAVFDKWVEFMQSVGIDQQINCYSMVPWKLTFQYFDQASNSMQSVDTEPGKADYNEMWTAMLTSFSKHLHQRGWFDKTVIAMDERPMKAMQQVITLIRKVDPGFKVALAGNYHKEIEKELFDYSIAWGQTYPEEVLQRRQAAGQHSTYYTCCTEAWPNLFSFSNPAEAIWISLFVAKDGVDGYLRWAANSWTKNPLLDSRFETWAAGDTYIVYPDGRTSIRFEKLREGIQAYEKIQVLKAEYAKKGNTAAGKNLQKMLDEFKGAARSAEVTRSMVDKAMTKLNKL